MLLVGCYALIFILAAFCDADFLGVAFDSGGVTTGSDDRAVHPRQWASVSPTSEATAARRLTASDLSRSARSADPLRAPSRILQSGQRCRRRSQPRIVCGQHAGRARIPFGDPGIHGGDRDGASAGRDGISPVPDHSDKDEPPQPCEDTDRNILYIRRAGAVSHRGKRGIFVPRARSSAVRSSRRVQSIF